MINILFHIISHDIWFYISHIFLHNPKIYFIHKVHHKKLYNQLTYKDATEGTLLEHIIEPLGIFIPYFLITFTFRDLFISFIIINIRNLLRHDDKFSFLIGNHHLLHHKYPKYNFGEYWIDKIFGTLYPNKSEYIYGKIYT